MKGDQQVIDYLNQALKNELTAINQYFLHYRMLEHWGIGHLAKFEYKESIDEMKHAEALIERILFLDAEPLMAPMELHVGKNVKEMLDADLKLELSAVSLYNKAIRVAVENADNGTRDLLTKILKEEEKHVDWLEAQVFKIGEIGYERYLITQASEGH